MMTHTGKSTQARQAWSDYWDRHSAGGQHLVGGAQHAELFEDFWRDALSPELEARSAVRLLDAACGDGAVARLCLRLADDTPDCTADVHGADYSTGALMALGELPGADGISRVAAGAGNLPYIDGAFDLVTSQCGLEYAGHDAFGGIARLLAPGGKFLAIIHCRDGVIFEECAANRLILDRLDASRVMTQCARLFELQRKRMAGHVGGPVVERAAGKLGLALTQLTEAVRLSPAGAARTHALRLLGDLATLQARHTAYAAEQAWHWLRVQGEELAAFRLRMESMMEAAADEAAISGIGARLNAGGLGAVTIGEIGRSDNNPPLAWSLSAAAA